MVSAELISMLRCPETQTSLSFAGDETLTRANNAIRAGRLTNRAGRRVDEELSGGLVREDGLYMYPIIEGIPVLLKDDAIALEQVNG